jgi:hypothetical protein
MLPWLPLWSRPPLPCSSPVCSPQAAGHNVPEDAGEEDEPLAPLASTISARRPALGRM